MAIVKDLGVVTAYAYAVAGGYEGTEVEFTEALGRAGIVVEQLENLTAVATTLSEGAEATASYADGVLTFGIPKGDTGATGPQGETGTKGDTGNGIESIAKTATVGKVDTYTITFTDGTTTTFEVTNGADGDITNVAQAFDATKAYSAGDMVLYQGTLYAFTAAHAAGVWVGSDAQAVILSDEVTALKDDLNVLPIIEIPSVNLYDNTNPNMINGFLGAQSGQVKFSSSPAARCLVIQLEASKTYVISKASNIGRWTFGLFPSVPTDQALGSNIHGTYVTQNNRNYVTFTTGTDNLYLVYYYYNTNDGVDGGIIRETVMLSEGTELYPYIPYGSTKMLLIGKNNLSEVGTAGQVLTLDNDDETLVWRNVPAQITLDSTLTQVGEAADAKATGDTIHAAVDGLEAQLGQVVLTQGVQDWLDDHPEAMVVIKVNGDADDTPEVGTEMLSDSGWTTTGWTGDFASGFTHTTGNTNALSCTLDALEVGTLYQFQITTSNAATNGWSDFRVSIGGSDTFETYKGGGASVSYIYGIVCGSTKVLNIIPRNDYTGTVTGLSLKKVTNTVGANYALTDTDGNITYEIRTVKADRNAFYQGVGSGSKAFWGYGNASIGDNAMKNNTSGFWNSALGYRALESNQNGSRNVAIGYIALRANTGGDRNVAIGTFALEDNTTGRNNVAINADAMQDNTTGHDNVGIGVRALVGNKTGFYNIGIGNNAGASNTTGSGNVGIGQNALTNNTGSNNIAIGNNAGDVSEMTGSNNIVIGYDADVPTASGSNQLVIGNNSIETVVIAGKTILFNQDGTVTWS